MTRHCPKCRALLILEDAPPGRPELMCGKVLYYRCSNCNTLWKEDQKGILPELLNLEEVPYFQKERVL